MSSSDQYKRQIMDDLAQGNTESLGDADMGSELQYENFDDFANRSSTKNAVNYLDNHCITIAFLPDN